MSWRGDKRTTAERGYGGRWQRERKRYLETHRLCVPCAKETPPRLTIATTVDHRIPHQGDPLLFWDKRNWQAMCTTHHSSDKQALEKSGRVLQRIGLDGFPVT